MDSVLNFLFQLTELIRTTRLVEFSLWVSDWPFAIWLQSHFYAIPGFQTVHILSIAILFASTLMLNLRVLGVSGKDQTLAQTFSRYQPWIWGALVCLVASGIVLLISEPVRNMVNSVFWLKMGALLVTVAVSLWFQQALRSRMDQWDVSPSGHASIRVGAVALIVLWLVVMIGGRWIAYAPN
ncbi:MAG: hypothetical protein P0Y56_04170 [Candidatus Andeanibacterium colombiense]|uniref:DUF6644 domain-containing protein n=1 Tax=Candidatus Andeanibacterium colombiense TaxID=3121345 RepID=A0AAJ5XB22_9SPHN|nr:MAG: hypothetical protein P0Y56_04170 [Sphingomonadaceae bacterium]